MQSTLRGRTTALFFRNYTDARVIPAAWLGAAIGISVIVVAAMLEWTGIVVAKDNHGAELIFGSMAALLTIRLLLRVPLTQGQRKLRDFSENMLIFMAICLLGVIASYPEAAETKGFSDASLEHMDTMLHFNWIAWYLAITAYPLLRLASMAAYSAIYVCPVVLMAYYAWAQEVVAARRFLLTFWLASVMTLLLFPLFPAEGPLAFLWHGPIPYMPTSALYQEQLIPALRSHRVSVIDLGSLRGLVCAPSFHAVSGVLYMIAAWPIRRLRWVLIPVNVAMLLSTPVEGTHYLVDIIVGMVVALFATVVVNAALRRLASAGHRIAYG